MSRMQTVEGLLKLGAWILLAVSTVSLLIIGFSNDIAPARFIGIASCVLFGIAVIYLIAEWLKG